MYNFKIFRYMVYGLPFGFLLWPTNTRGGPSKRHRNQINSLEQPTKFGYERSMCKVVLQYKEGFHPIHLCISNTNSL